MRREWLGALRGLLLVGVAFGGWACDDGADEPADGGVSDASVDAGSDADGADTGGSDGGADAAIVLHEEDPNCDSLVPTACALPWPSSQFLVPDDGTETRLRLAFGERTLPANRSDRPLDPAMFGHMDGYGVGNPIIVHFPGVDLSGLATEDQIERSMAADAAVLLWEDRGEGWIRIPYFVELDSRVSDPATQVMYVRPAVLLREDTRYVVAFRGLKTTDGAPVAPSEAFAALRSGDTRGWPLLSGRQAGFEGLFEALEGQGVERSSLLLAWDFHTRSCASLHGRMLSIRDQGSAAIATDGYQVRIDSVQTYSVAENEHIAVDLEGVVRVPHFMVETEAVFNRIGFVMALGGGGDPTQAGWREAPFVLRVPHGALDGTPHGLVQYGHGLNGTYGQAKSGHLARFAAEHRLLAFGVNLVGMSNEDVSGILVMLQDLNLFPWLADRLHQGLLDSLMVARALREVGDQLPELSGRGVQIDPARVYYTGDSQGGIFGATYMALSQDVVRGQLGVPGQNYSTLLRRSVDFNPFLLGLKGTYPNPIDRAVLLAAIQLRWDETDPVSYYRHISAEPFPDTPAHAVLASTAKGDYQVSVMTMEIVARTADVGVGLLPNYDDERTVAMVDEVSYPHVGSGLTNWHFGNAWPPLGNVPPPDDEFGDPHGRPRKLRAFQRQMAHFFETGEIVDVCEGHICEGLE